MKIKLFALSCICTPSRASTSTSPTTTSTWAGSHERSKKTGVEFDFDITPDDRLSAAWATAQIELVESAMTINGITVRKACEGVRERAPECIDTKLNSSKAVEDCLAKMKPKNCSMQIGTRMGVSIPAVPEAELCHTGHCFRTVHVPHVILSGSALVSIAGSRNYLMSIELHPNRPVPEFEKAAIAYSSITPGAKFAHFANSTGNPDCTIDSHGHIGRCQKMHFLRLPEKDEALVYLLYSDYYDYSTDVTLAPEINLISECTYAADGTIL